MASLKYRVDYEVTTENSQTIGYTDWIGGPTIARIKGALCSDGSVRTAYVTGEPSTWFSIPARVNVGKKSYNGTIVNEDGIYRFTFYN
jgi:hypothetical protein